MSQKPRRLPAVLLLVLYPPLLAAQDPPTPPAPPAATQGPEAPAEQSRFPKLSYPADRDFVVAEVGGANHTLEQLLVYVEARHQPGLRQFLGQDGGRLMLGSDLIAPWTRHYADIQALRTEAAERKLDVAQAEALVSGVLKEDFEKFLAVYTEGLRERGKPTELSQARVNSLLNDYQLRHGMGSELQGWLDFLTQGETQVEIVRREAQQFYNAHPRTFGGLVTFEHILIQHRDAGTGILLHGKAAEAARARLADVEARLKPDGSNFGEVARLMSEDTRTASQGGLLRNVQRFDPRLPTALCRAAWGLRDGQISGVVESQYGLHLVRRVEFNQQRYIIVSDATMPEVLNVMRRQRQEDLLFATREKHRIKLFL